MRRLINVRRIIQLFIIVVLVVSPLSQIVRTYKQIPYPYAESPLIQHHHSKSILEKNSLDIKNVIAHVYDDINGGPYTLDFYMFNFQEPLTAMVYSIRNIFNSGYWNLVQIMSVVISLGMAFFLGRVFCGYVCPWSLIVSWNLKVQRKFFNRTSASTASIEKGITTSQSVLFVLMAGIIVLNPLILQYILLPAIVQHAISDYILFGSFSLWALMAVAFVAIEIMQPAMICRTLCPTGVLLSYTGKSKVITLDFNKKNKCLKGCELCNDVCWLGLHPKSKPVDSACDMCARCIDICPTNRLTIKSKKKKK